MYRYKSKLLSCLFTIFCLTCLLVQGHQFAYAGSASQTFAVLTYNVAGLPEGLSSGHPATNTIKISSLLNDYDIVAVQEDFAYHNDLIKYVTSSYLTTTSGNVPLGDGINFISKIPFYDTDREKWNQSSGIFDDGCDQLTPKGFMYSQFELEPGVYVDVYTLHTDAGDDSGSYAARYDNMTQLADYINTYSNGNAVIVLGDTNSRYTRAADNFEMALLDACGLTDTWIELVRGGSVPADGEALTDTTDKNGPKYEVVDKVFYRSSKSVTLAPLSYRLEDTKFVDTNGDQLSDHYPVTVQFQYAKASDVTLSESFGGPGGTAFNNLATLPDSRPVKLSMRSGNRVDATAITYADGTVLSNGGNGGTENSINLASDEYISKVYLCKGIKTGTNNYRIFYASFTTNKGQILYGGTGTSDSVTFTAPSGWYIAGFFGRAEDEVDKLGVIFKLLPLPTN